MRKDIFISYSSKDETIARKIAEDLKNNDIKVWFDIWDIPLGGNIIKEIQIGLETSRQLIVLLSQNSLNSYWVEEEWTKKFGTAISSGDIVVIPVIIGKIDEKHIPMFLRGLNHIDIISKTPDAEISRLISDIKKRRKEESINEIKKSQSLQDALQTGLVEGFKSKPEDYVEGIVSRIFKKIKLIEGQDVDRVIRVISLDIAFEIERIGKVIEDMEYSGDSIMLMLAFQFKDKRDLLKMLFEKIEYIKQSSMPNSEILDDIILELNSKIGS